MTTTISAKQKTTKYVVINIPLDVLEQIDQIAVTEDRTRSKVIKRALKEYVDSYSK